MMSPSPMQGPIIAAGIAQIPVARGALVMLACLMCGACDLAKQPQSDNKTVRYGDPIRGRAIVASGAHGCLACHTIPGIRAAIGIVGPPLNGIAQRALIAGQLPNQPETLVAFLQDPPALVPDTGMPDVRVSLEEARHIAAFLYTLEATDAR